MPTPTTTLSTHTSTATHAAKAFARKTLVVTATPHTVTHHTVHRATHAVARHVTHTAVAASPLALHGIPGWVWYVVVGVLLMAGIVILALTLMRRRALSHTRSSQRLARAVRSPASDAVGVVLYMDRGTASIVPLRKVEGIYLSTDPQEPVIIIGNPYAQPFSIDGKPLIVAMGFHTIAQQLNAPLMTRLGLARVAFDVPEWEDTSDPGKAFDEIVTKLLTKHGTLTGRIRVGPRLSIAFQMAVPAAIQALLLQQLEQTNVVLAQLTDWTRSMENLARQLEARAKELQAKGQMWRHIIIAVGALIGMIAIMGILFMLLGGIHLPIPHHP